MDFIFLLSALEPFLDLKTYRPTPNLYVYLICAVLLGLLIIIIIFHPDVTSISKDRVRKSADDLIRKTPQSKDCCNFKKTNHFNFIVMRKIPVPKELAN